MLDGRESGCTGEETGFAQCLCGDARGGSGATEELEERVIGDEKLLAGWVLSGRLCGDLVVVILSRAVSFSSWFLINNLRFAPSTNRWVTHAHRTQSK